MKYTITYSCGHKGTVDLYGATKNHQWKLDKMAQEKCADCRKQDYYQENVEDVEKSKELNLPTLTGSEKQVLWANSIRINAIDALKHLAKPTIESMSSKPKLLQQFNETFHTEFVSPTDLFETFIKDTVNAHTASTWWIDNKDDFRSDLWFSDQFKKWRDSYAAKEEKTV